MIGRAAAGFAFDALRAPLGNGPLPIALTPLTAAMSHRNQPRAAGCRCWDDPCSCPGRPALLPRCDGRCLLCLLEGRS